jgi:hypothetical protein
LAELTDSRAADALRRLESWGWERGWTGADPYDGLSARRVPAALLRPVRAKQVLTQVVKRSPLNLRPLLGVPPGRSPVTFANLATTYALNGFLDEAEAKRRTGDVLATLDTLRSPGYEEPCWGYHFDVQTRVFFYPAFSPNTIATSYAGRALLDAGRVEEAERVGDFFLRHVPQTGDEPGAFFGYLVDDRTPIHNASLLVCALLARLAAATGRDDFRTAAARGVEWSVARQRPDGSWPYGERPGLEWVDGFHTGYVLECLMACDAAGVGVDADVLKSGIDFYARELFEADGTPKYYPTSTYPVDVQCAAQGIQTFAIAGRSGDATRVLDYALRELQRPDGAFVFQRRRRWVNRVPHMRWAAAPMAMALAHYVNA